MKIALINGSPKVKNSASESFLLSVKNLLPNEYEMMEYHFMTPFLSTNDLEQIAESDVLVFAFPLYVDGLPSQLIHCIHQMEIYFKIRSSREITAYALVNCGFYEGHQCAIAMDIMKNWCVKAKITWGQGLGIGGGGMLQSLAKVPDGKGLKKNFSKGIKAITSSIAARTTAEDMFISPNFPRIAYKIGAEMGWRKQIKANGLKPKDLFKQI